MSVNRIKRLLKEVKEKTGIKTALQIKLEKGKDYYAAQNGWRIFNICIGYLYIDKKALKFSDDALKAIILHELGHYFISLEGHEEERECDMFVINKGFGKELLQFHTEHEKKYKKYKKKDGLTRKEIEKLLKYEK